MPSDAFSNSDLNHIKLTNTNRITDFSKLDTYYDYSNVPAIKLMP